MARKHFKTGQLVASTNPLRKILSKRLIISVRIVDKGLSKQVISEEVVGIRTDL